MITDYCNDAQHDKSTQREVVDGLKIVEERGMLRAEVEWGICFLWTDGVLRDGAGKRVLPRRISPPSVT
jgi:hypothetical protein